MFDNFGQNKSMWGTPGQPGVSGGNNINTQGMWSGAGFMGGAGGQWQDKPIKTMNIQSTPAPPSTSPPTQGTQPSSPQQNPWSKNITTDNPYMFPLGKGQEMRPQGGQSLMGNQAQNPMLGGNPINPMAGGMPQNFQNPGQNQQNIMQFLQMLRGQQGG